ncbi:MAG TPA: M23 family metallopeptidase [Candidatus Acidoferrales bacterium]|nr:M23 family metallopeptidase [Candidatus Acidoferrales bacterium]
MTKNAELWNSLAPADLPATQATTTPSQAGATPTCGTATAAPGKLAATVGKPAPPGVTSAPARGATTQPITFRQRFAQFVRVATCPYRRLLVKIVPHSGGSIYKVELSHRHLTLAGLAAVLLVGFFFWVHVADVRAAEARARTLAKVDAQQHQELAAFTKETRLLWQKVGKLQHEDDEMRRYAKVIAPAAAPAHEAAAKTAVHTHTQFSAVDPPAWRRVLAWLVGLGAQSQFGFEAEASELKSLSDAMVSTGRQTNALESTIQAAAERKIAAELARERYFAGIPSIWPTLGYISSGFGYRSYPDTEFHPGLDIVNDYGAPIYATATGVVVEAGWYYGYGLRVVIDHGNGLRTMYAHASEVLVSTGQEVKKGQEIALVGETGFATGPHCHYQIELWGRPIDPTPFLDGSVKTISPSTATEAPLGAATIN